MILRVSFFILLNITYKVNKKVQKNGKSLFIDDEMDFPFILFSAAP